jgi:hypothetical protein
MTDTPSTLPAPEDEAAELPSTLPAPAPRAGATPSGWPYALPTDPRINWPATSQALAEKLELLAADVKTYTPSISGWSLGNGTVEGVYIRLGRLVFLRVSVTAGSSTTAPASGQIWATLPPGLNSTGRAFGTSGVLTDQSAPQQYLVNVFQSGANYSARPIGANGANGSMPFTLAAGDSIVWGSVYEAAA